MTTQYRRLSIMLCALGVGWIYLMAFLQGGLDKVGSISIIVLGSAAFIGGFVLLKRLGKNEPILMAYLIVFVVGAAVLLNTGFFNSFAQMLWDIGGLFLGALFAVILDWFLKFHPRYVSVNDQHFFDGSPSRIGFAFLVQALMFWVGISIVAVVRPPIPAPNPDRFSEVTAVLEVPEEVATALEQTSIGIALSGGGYRAAIYHTGTLHALEQLGIKAKVLSTVSGGSIIGAYYAQGGDPLAFKQEAAAGRFNYYREFSLLHNMVRLVCPMRLPILDVEVLPFCRFSRGDLQVSLLDRVIFNGDEHRVYSKAAPRLIINTVDTTYGLLLGFTADGLLLQAPDGSSEFYTGEAYQPSQRFSLAERVAISGAFPGAFPSVEFDVRVDPLGATGDGTRRLHLVDGGVADNTGLEMLVTARHCADPQTRYCSPSESIDPDYATDLMLVSDASAIFGIEPDLNGVAGLSRAFDISGARAKRFEPDLSGATQASYSAQNHYLSPIQLFRLYRDAHGDAPGGPRQTSVQVLPRKHQPDFIVKAMVELLPRHRFPDVRARFDSMVAGAPAADDPSFKEWSKITGRATKNEIDQCKSDTNPRPEVPVFCETALVIYTLETELRRLLNVFRNASTLDDQLGRDVVNDLNVLGQMIVFIEWRELTRALKSQE